MTNFGVANILYHLATDMDYADYEETEKTDIAKIKEELDSLGEDSSLYRAITEIVRKETE